MSKSTQQSPKQSWDYEVEGTVDGKQMLLFKKAIRQRLYSYKEYYMAGIGMVIQRVPVGTDIKHAKVSSSPDGGY